MLFNTVASADGVTNDSLEPPAKRSMFWRMEQRAQELRTRAPGGDNNEDDICEVYRKWTNPKALLNSKIPDALLQAYTEFNTTLPSSAPVERLFSLGKRVLTPTRTLLSDENFEIMVMCATSYINKI